MKQLKILIVAVAAAVAIPAQADITSRDVFGVALGAFIGYQMTRPHTGHTGHIPGQVYAQPGYIPPVPVYPVYTHVPVYRAPTCVLRQAYSAPGHGPIYVQECH